MRPAESGFTLIELLVVVAIIGILAAVAIPAYGSFKSQGIDAQMESSLRNARTASEAFYVKNFTYAAMTLTDLTELGFRPTFGVDLAVTPSGDGSGYTLRACAAGGNSPSFIVTSGSAAATPDPGSCA